MSHDDDNSAFLCPINQTIMTDPVVDPEGNSYERTAIMQWLQRNQTSPVTRNPLTPANLVPNRALQYAIEQYKAVQAAGENSSAVAPTVSQTSASEPEPVQGTGTATRQQKSIDCSATSMAVHRDWPYNVLNVRRTSDPNSDIVARVDTRQQNSSSSQQRYQFQVLESESTPSSWRLHPGSKACLRVVKEYDEKTEGYVVRSFAGHTTLQRPLAAESNALRPVTDAQSHGLPATTRGGDVTAAAALLRSVMESDGKLLILTGAGMSVSSGVPVFRMSDGSMSPDFLRFLGGYNDARRRHGLTAADDWFEFSVPEMFSKATEREAWAYWRWRTLRALVEPAEDYKRLNQLVRIFGVDRSFVVTSNCDMLHERAGMPPLRVHEIHGSLGRLQCAKPCCEALYPADEQFLARLRSEPDWVPRCPNCPSCLRPNVMIFGDSSLVESELDRQRRNLEAFQEAAGSTRHGTENWVVLEIGAGVVVPSIRHQAELLGSHGAGLIRVNPSAEECASVDERLAGAGNKYHPLVSRSSDALRALVDQLY